MEDALWNDSALPIEPDIIVCLETGWTWNELQATPAWVVRDVKSYLRKQAKVAKRKQKMRESRSRR